MLAEHGIDIDPGADVVGRIDRADLDETTPVAGIDLAQVAGRRGIDQRARVRIAGHAALELVQPPGQALFVALAEKVGRSQNAAGRLGVLLLVAHRGEQPAPADLNFDLAADLAGLDHRWIVAGSAFGQALQIDRDHAATAGNLQDNADRIAGTVIVWRIDAGRIGGACQVLRGSRPHRLKILTAHI